MIDQMYHFYLSLQYFPQYFHVFGNSSHPFLNLPAYSDLTWDLPGTEIPTIVEYFDFPVGPPSILGRNVDGR